MVIVNPKTNQFYYSYYLSQLKDNFNIINYDSNPFPDFHHHCLAMILKDFSEKKIYISAGDGPGFNQLGLEWCDIYAKVNVHKEQIPKKFENKILPIGPSFGLNYLSLKETLTQLWVTTLRSKMKLREYREHFANFYRQWKYRAPLSAYIPGNVETDYIFHASTLWRKEPDTNTLRARFMDIANNNPKIKFDGGFAPGKQDVVNGFDHLIMPKKMIYDQYLEKVKRSLVVFNTPAVQGCLGWKLAEYMACGKAIISMPISQLLPAPLNNHEHIHFVDGTNKSLENAINEIRTNKKYRKRLESNSREYYQKYLSPKAVMDRIVSFKVC